MSKAPAGIPGKAAMPSTGNIPGIVGDDSLSGSGSGSGDVLSSDGDDSLSGSGSGSGSLSDGDSLSGDGGLSDGGLSGDGSLSGSGSGSLSGSGDGTAGPTSADLEKQVEQADDLADAIKASKGQLADNEAALKVAQNNVDASLQLIANQQSQLFGLIEAIETEATEIWKDALTPANGADQIGGSNLRMAAPLRPTSGGPAPTKPSPVIGKDQPLPPGVNRPLKT